MLCLNSRARGKRSMKRTEPGPSSGTSFRGSSRSGVHIAAHRRNLDLDVRRFCTAIEIGIGRTRHNARLGDEVPLAHLPRPSMVSSNSNVSTPSYAIRVVRDVNTIGEFRGNQRGRRILWLCTLVSFGCRQLLITRYVTSLFTQADRRDLTVSLPGTLQQTQPGVSNAMPSSGKALGDSL